MNEKRANYLMSKIFNFVINSMSADGFRKSASDKQVRARTIGTCHVQAPGSELFKEIHKKRCMITPFKVFTMKCWVILQEHKHVFLPMLFIDVDMVMALCERNPPMIGWVLSWRASNAESGSMSWYIHYFRTQCDPKMHCITVVWSRPSLPIFLRVTSLAMIRLP